MIRHVRHYYRARATMVAEMMGVSDLRLVRKMKVDILHTLFEKGYAPLWWSFERGQMRMADPGEYTYVSAFAVYLGTRRCRNPRNYRGIGEMAKRHGARSIEFVTAVT